MYLIAIHQYSSNNNKKVSYHKLIARQDSWSTL